jgi:GntR family transcriptional regulator, carbon starvation induced regulator
MTAEVHTLRSSETLATTAYTRLRREILTSVLQPGAKLRIRELCDRYQMSISPIREALNRVSREGLVQQVDQRGFSVAPLSIEDLEELTKTRCWVNEVAVRQSIINGDRAWEEAIVVACHRMVRTRRFAADGSPSEEWEILHRAFHTSLISACGSRALLQFCEQLFDAADRYRFLWRPNPRDTRWADAHRELMEAVVARDADQAVHRLFDHFDRSAGRAMQRLKEIEQVARKNAGRRRR